MDVFQVPEGVKDVFRLSDEELSETYRFYEEIGFGNWGSVWLCAPRHQRIVHTEGAPQVVAAKLVHREKTQTAAARVRSLWNEMKIVRSLKDDPHPSIIQFHSFVITPSYALITMDHVPRLIPVEVDECIARDWFQSLLSGIVYLHERGIVHNDIKPANILITKKRIPVLVDFGFAEKHELGSAKDFVSDLGYGTPEYLSPERARGMEHDTRKSDVWSLGITFFEVLAGRTPFEYEEGEEFSTKEDLERYWTRTLRGKWVGSWKMSRPVENLLRRMLSPNADLRYTAPQAMLDEYWSLPPPPPRKVVEVTAGTDVRQSGEGIRVTERSRAKSPATPVAVHKENTSSRPVATSPPWSPARAFKDKTNQMKASVTTYISPHGGSLKTKRASELHHTRSHSRTIVSPPETPHGQPQSKQRPALVKPMSPISTPVSATAKENQLRQSKSARRLVATTSKTASKMALRNPVPVPLSPVPSERGRPPTAETDPSVHFNTAIQTTTFSIPGPVDQLADLSSGTIKKISASERVLEWQREKQRLRQLEKLRESEKVETELEVDYGNIAVTEPAVEASVAEPDILADTSLQATVAAGQLFVEAHEPTLMNGLRDLSLSMEDSPRGSIFPVGLLDLQPPGALEDGIRGLKQSLKVSIDKAMRLYKVSSLGRATNKTSSSSLTSESQMRMEHSRKESWEDNDLIKQADSSLPVVRHAVRSERLAADNQIDRMTIWINSVEKVVEDARRSFASGGPMNLPTLPPAPPLSCTSSQTRRNRGPRTQRNILAADQIFAAEHVDSSTVLSDGARTLNETTQNSMQSGLSEVLDGRDSPSRGETKSQYDLLTRAISPIARLQEELERPPAPAPPVPLLAVVDKRLFVGRPFATLRKEPSVSEIAEETSSMTLSSPKSRRNASTPPRLRATSPPGVDVPSPNTQRRIATEYNHILVNTSGVKRVGKGYQSNVSQPVSNIPLPKRNSKFFYSTRRMMPPPVSSDDAKHGAVDELGMVPLSVHGHKDVKGNTTGMVRQAFMSIINTKGMPRRSSKVF